MTDAPTPMICLACFWCFEDDSAEVCPKCGSDDVEPIGEENEDDDAAD